MVVSACEAMSRVEESAVCAVLFCVVVAPLLEDVVLESVNTSCLDVLIAAVPDGEPAFTLFPTPSATAFSPPF